MDRRDVVEHALQRRAVLRDVYAGRATTTDVCDASPYLGRAAKAYGVQTDRGCPRVQLADRHSRQARCPSVTARVRNVTEPTVWRRRSSGSMGP